MVVPCMCLSCHDTHENSCIPTAGYKSMSQAYQDNRHDLQQEHISLCGRPDVTAATAFDVNVCGGGPSGNTMCCVCVGECFVGMHCMYCTTHFTCVAHGVPQSGLCWCSCSPSLGTLAFSKCPKLMLRAVADAMSLVLNRCSDWFSYLKSTDCLSPLSIRTRFKIVCASKTFSNTFAAGVASKCWLVSAHDYKNILSNVQGMATLATITCVQG